YNSEFKVRNMTDGEDIATGLMIGDGSATNTAYANWLTASKIDENTYYLHQVCPAVGVALYKVTSTTVGIDNVKTVKANLFSTADGLTAEFDGEATIEIFTVTGKLIEKAVANNVYNTALKAGAYLVRINGETFKFVK
ncbi:MAG: T9SS type A sorting domain-containing protein, partial [Paludibacteraceae bacterium]|nr:T9SS type A sorting domain-containing protein [Paludibacteraceae bacterium]